MRDVRQGRRESKYKVVCYQAAHNFQKPQMVIQDGSGEVGGPMHSSAGGKASNLSSGSFLSLISPHIDTPTLLSDLPLPLQGH